MKKLCILAVCMFMISNLFSQKLVEKDVPAEVTKTFNSKFAQPANVKWEKADALFKAEFIQNDLKTIAEYTATGQWIKTGWEIPQQYAPKSITDYITANYPKYKIDALMIFEEDKATQPGKYYMAFISKKKEKTSVKFNLKGEFSAPAPTPVPEKK